MRLYTHIGALITYAMSDHLIVPKGGVPLDLDPMERWVERGDPWYDLVSKYDPQLVLLSAGTHIHGTEQAQERRFNKTIRSDMAAASLRCQSHTAVCKSVQMYRLLPGRLRRKPGNGSPARRLYGRLKTQADVARTFSLMIRACAKPAVGLPVSPIG